MGCPTTYEGKTLTWSKGRLSGMRAGTAAMGIQNYAYTYNGLGQRIARSYSKMKGTSGALMDGELTNSSKQYFYDHSGRLVAETGTRTYNGAASESESIVYLYDESGIIGMEYTLNGTTSTYYFHRNLLGDVIGIYSMAGVLVVKYIYDAWGNCTIAGDTTNDALAHANPIRYRGYYYDDDTGLYYLNARYYSPKWRRFISPDTETVNPYAVNGLSTYVYANNNPLSNCPSKQKYIQNMTYSFPLHIPQNKVIKVEKASPLGFSVGLVTPESVNMPPWMEAYGFYVKGTLGWGYTFGEGYSLASFGIGVLDTTFHLPKLLGFLPDDHLANPNIFLGVGTWNANVSLGIGISGTAEILSGTIGAQFGDSVSFGIKGYVGIGFTLDFTNGIRIGAGLGLGFEVFLAIDWYELFN